MEPAPNAMTPDELFELTATYHDFGIHRTGTAPDLATTDWFFGRLADLGADLRRRQVDFDRYDVRSTLVDARGEAIPCEAVSMSSSGDSKELGSRLPRCR